MYASGKHARAMCDICGFEVAYTSLRKQWDGFMACRGCLDSRHPQDFPRSVPTDPETLRNPRADNDAETQIGHIYAFGASAMTNGGTPVGGTFEGQEATSSIGSVTVTTS